MSKFLHVKCYLFPNDVPFTCNELDLADEIRRFPLRNVIHSGIYEVMMRSILYVYKDFLLPGDELKTFWLDEENDLVSFSTDKEIQFAIETCRKLTVDEERYVDPPMSQNGSSAEDDLEFVFRIYISIFRPSRIVLDQKSEEKEEN